MTYANVWNPSIQPLWMLWRVLVAPREDHRRPKHGLVPEVRLDLFEWTIFLLMNSLNCVEWYNKIIEDYDRRQVAMMHADLDHQLAENGYIE